MLEPAPALPGRHAGLAPVPGGGGGGGCPRRWTLLVHLVMLLLLLWQAYSCYFLLEAYGPLAFFLSPVRTWALLLSLLLVYRAWRGPVPHLSSDVKASLAS